MIGIEIYYKLYTFMYITIMKEEIKGVNETYKQWKETMSRLVP